MASNNENPWLGLKTYSEGQILYGRTEEISALSQDILFNRQTVVYGKSGIGKSSLLNAGVYPLLRRANMFPVNVRLVHNDSETSYGEQIKRCVEESLGNLRRAFVGTDGKRQIIKGLKGRKEELCPLLLDDKRESLWEFFHRHIFYDDLGNEIQPVVVFDQFEEIFTLCKDEEVRKEFFDQLADLINDVPPSYIYASNKKANEEDAVVDEVIDGSKEFILEEDDEEEQTLNYLQEPKYHIVITLREEFLSYLEWYTTNIPLLKHNRYCLKPLSDDQAGIIIMDPLPGLISEDVAVEIICKVTDAKPHDFKLGDGIVQLEVDSAMLSLFLSELYKKKDPEDSTISIELVREIGDNIISTFYERTISQISVDSAKFLEERLVTKDGRRDSVYEDIVFSNGVTTEELNFLKQERLIHEFPWNDDLRIEFMHDTLCPIIIERRKEREQKRLQEEEDKRKEEETQRLLQEEERKRLEVERRAEEEKTILLLKQRKRNRIYWGIIASALVLFIVLFALLYNRIFPPRQCQLFLIEDETVGLDNFWKTKVSLININEQSDTLYPVQTLDKSHFQATYLNPTVDSVRVVLQFLAGNFNTIDTVVAIRDSMYIPISRAYGRKKYTGKVIYGQEPGQPLKNAVVIIGSQITKTNHKGFFTIYAEPSDLSDDGTVKIYKNGYSLLNTKIMNDSADYKLQPEDSRAFERRLSSIEIQIANHGFEMRGVIADSPCYLQGYMKNDSIYGFYYYDKSIQQEKNRKYAYIIFSGKIYDDNTFHLDCCDWVYNLEELNGKINDDNSWEGYWNAYLPDLYKFKFEIIDVGNEK